MINKVFYFTVSYVVGSTSVKSVLTVPEPFKWLPSRKHWLHVKQKEEGLNKAEND